MTSNANLTESPKCGQSGCGSSATWRLHAPALLEGGIDRNQYACGEHKPTLHQKLEIDIRDTATMMHGGTLAHGAVQDILLK